jgi:hypothetical protein
VVNKKEEKLKAMNNYQQTILWRTLFLLQNEYVYSAHIFDKMADIFFSQLCPVERNFSGW